MKTRAPYLVFISGPGDTTDEKDALSEAISQLNKVLQNYGIRIDDWRYDTHAVPLAGRDAQSIVNQQLPIYDLYVGLMGERFGTKTPRAGSGTEEEFLDAIGRQKETGRPPVLFYFRRMSDRTPDDRVQTFRRSYAGLYESYESVPELQRRFKDHLLYLVLRRDEPLSARSSRGWSERLAEQLDRLPPIRGPFDASSEAVCRRIERLNTLFDLGRSLTDEEQDALLAAEYLRTIRSRDGITEFNSRQPEVAPTFGRKVLATIEEVADHAEAPEFPIESRETGSIRVTLLAALVRFGALLDQDRERLLTSLSFTRATSEENITAVAEAWLALATRRIEVDRGVVCYHLVLSPRQIANAPRVCKLVALRFELGWHALRPVLSKHGFAVARSPQQFVPAVEMPDVPESIWKEWAAWTLEAEAGLPKLLHLGGRSAPELRRLLPLPSVATSVSLSVSVEPGWSCTLSIRAESTDREIYSATSLGTDRIDIPQEAMPAGIDCAWELRRDDGDFERAIRNGRIRRLLPRDEVDLAAANGNRTTRLNKLFVLRLWNDLFTEAWPQVLDGTADTATCAMLYEVLLRSHQWLLEHPISERPREISSQIELVRETSRIVHTLLLNFNRVPL